MRRIGSVALVLFLAVFVVDELDAFLTPSHSSSYYFISKKGLVAWHHQQPLEDFPCYSLSRLYGESPESPAYKDSLSLPSRNNDSPGDRFDLETALFCGGLAFDAYVEPPSNSSRWERGSKGMNVAFLSPAFTRNIYKGLVEVTPIECAGLPSEDDTVESVMTGNGVDAALLVALVEGQYEEDMKLLKEQYHEGVLDLSGATHVARSRTAWSNVDKRKSEAEKRKTGKALPYHIPKSWGKDAAAVWEDEDPLYIYIQEPKNAKIVFTLFDDDVVGQGGAIGSVNLPLQKVLPQVAYSQDEIVQKMKLEVMDKIQRGEISPQDIDSEIAKAVNMNIQSWQGDLKLNSKPRIKNKNNQAIMGAAAGAMLAGPAGAAMGAALGSMYEGQVKGRITVKLRYLPVPQTPVKRKKYEVLGGMEGITWGKLYEKFLAQKTGFSTDEEISTIHVAGSDLEHCFFINHDETGGCCAVYRSLEKKLIVVSFRGTCTPVDLVTDASIVQEPWVKGEDPENEDNVAQVHVGFRRSMNSISRRLKELLLATVAPGDSISDYDVLVTGHSLGGALATLFTADIGEYGIDAGRALPQSEPSDAWWKAITNTFMGREGEAGAQTSKSAPPRPRTLRLYNFGSPRVGNKAFSDRFNTLLQDGRVDQAYRIVNDQDGVARMPRTMRTLSVDYDHVGKTVLIEEPTQEDAGEVLWIEGESDDRECPVRDYEANLSSPTAEGTLLGDLFSMTQESLAGQSKDEKEEQLLRKLGSVGSKFQKRLSTITAADITSVIGIDRSFTDREIKLVQSLFKGDALTHHMEDSYYAAMG